MKEQLEQWKNRIEEAILNREFQIIERGDIVIQISVCEIEATIWIDNKACNLYRLKLKCCTVELNNIGSPLSNVKECNKIMTTLSKKELQKRIREQQIIMQSLLASAGL